MLDITHGNSPALAIRYDAWVDANGFGLLPSKSLASDTEGMNFLSNSMYRAIARLIALLCPEIAPAMLIISLLVSILN